VVFTKNRDSGAAEKTRVFKDLGIRGEEFAAKTEKPGTGAYLCSVFADK
jgi:hypothetical protein